ncbi:ComEA family DNA-binding protein [Neisseriaceae bacterium B1]
MKFKSLLLAAVTTFSMSLAGAAVNINTATAEELDALPGIGAAKAQAIVDYRTKNGPFKTVEELDNVKGIGPTLLEKLKPEATVSGTPAKAKEAKQPVQPKK